MFVFEDRWQVTAPPERVRDVLVDLEHYPQWWPQVVAVAKLGPDDARVLCRSTLPFTLDLVLHAVSRDLPTIEVDITGTLCGYVRWTLTSAGAGGTDMAFDQRVTATPLLETAGWVARPLLRWNHHRMMVGCREGLVRRLAMS